MMKGLRNFAVIALGAAWLFGQLDPAYSGVGGPGVTFPWGQFGLPSCATGMVLYNNNGQIGCEESPANVSIGVIKKIAGATNVTQIFGTGTTTNTSNVYASAAAPGAVTPNYLQNGQVYFINFPSANTGPSTINIIKLGAKAIKIVDSLGAILTLVGGEIVAGPGILYYDGTEYLYTTFAGPSNIPVVGSTAVTQGNFANRDTFYLTGGGETLTLPCSTALSANDQILVFSVSGTATIDVAASPCADNIIKNGNTSTTAQTVAQGAAAAVVLTDGAGNVYVSGS